jgi:FtsP/CotA-like multicopper oxidase with cupredoxin domain
MTRDRLRLLIASVVTLAVLLPLGYLWQQSRMPSTYSVMDMGYLDFGGGPRGVEAAAGNETAAGVDDADGMTGMAGMEHGSGGRSVAELTAGTDRRADRVVDLLARKGRVHLASGRSVDGYTLNGTSPGPLVEATRGQLLEVHLHNANVPDGITLHWHGVDVPNAEDGVAGVTQDAVMPGQDHTYRFVAKDAGTYWYHSHQVSHEQVIGGLLGPLVVHERHPATAVKDVVALAHTYAGASTLDGRASVRVLARPGQQVRVREINTDNGPTRTWASGPYRVLAVDGRDVNRPTDVTGRSTVLTAGGRVDLGVVVPQDGSGVRVQVGSSTSVLVGPAGAEVAEPGPPEKTLDLLGYGSPAPLGFDPDQADRHFRYDIGRQVGFVRGRPGLWWSVNGHLFPNLPMYVVRDGDVVRMRIKNSSGDVHPMHLHGHHAVVLSRNGVQATGSPWWFDSLNVEDGETYDVAFVADNPGVWMDHCHNLKHARQGLVAHLMYAGVTEPYRVGGSRENQPE